MSAIPLKLLQDFYLYGIASPILGITITKIGVKTLKQRAILFSLVRSCVGHFIEKEQIMSNRVLNRVGARELTPEEVESVAAGTTTGCRGTSLHKNGPIVDVRCDPAF